MKAILRKTIICLIIPELLLGIAACGAGSNAAASLDGEAAAGVSAEAEEVTQMATTAARTTEAPTTEVTTEAVTEDPVILRFAGDFTLAEEGGEGLYMAIMDTFDSRYDGDITQVFSEELLQLMQDADIFMLNNEFTFTDRGTPTPNKTWTFRASPERVSQLSALGVDIVGLANNHAYDWGEVSLLDTLDTLDAAGIEHVGAGKNLEEACQAVYFTIGGKTFSFVSMTFVEHSGVGGSPQTRAATEDSAGTLHAGVNPEEAMEAVRTAKANSDYCVAFVHWGVEQTTELDEDQKEYSRKIIDAGADAIIGNHPHVLQGIEFYNGKPIAYSLGNYWFNSKERKNGLLELAVDTATMEVQVKFIPCLQKNCRTVLITDEESRLARLQEMESLSIGVSIDEDGVVTNKN